VITYKTYYMNVLRYITHKIRQWGRTHNFHTPIITIEINRHALLENVATMQKMAHQWKIAPVLKSNAYGHGLIVVADILKNSNVAFLCVDSYPEATLIRNAGITTPILIMGFTPNTTIASCAISNVSFVISSLEQLEHIKNYKTSIHIKFDTGMHRRGIMPQKINEAIALIRTAQFQVQGVMSHFAESETDSTQTRTQITIWNELAKKMQATLPTITYYHLANSGGFAYHNDINANVGRTGIAMYGINPGNISAPLSPVLQMKSIISEIRTLEAGESIGYSHTYTASKKTLTGTIPVGYFEGLDRRLSNTGVFIIRNQFAPIIGRVSMNMSSCDITNIPDIKVHDVVTIIDARTDSKNSVVSIARTCETIPYEILVNIPAGLRRVVV